MQGPGFNDMPTGFAPGVCAEALAEGARNLLVNCAGMRPGQSVLVVAEDPGLGWYDAEAPNAVAEMARYMGARVTTLAVGDPAELPPTELPDEIANHDITVFFARIGDKHRFCASNEAHVCVMSYARTAAALASSFGRRDHRTMLRLKELIDEALHGAAEIEITCPRGTHVIGPPPAKAPLPDVTIRRFPMCMPAPVCTKGMTGRVALAGYLTPTGSQSYEPACLDLPHPVFARLSGGRVVGYDGNPACVERIQAHYSRVADQFGIDPDRVHSWHAGIHDGCAFPGDPADDPDLWANSVFGHPGWLHFHTCGDYAPGEIAWSVFDPTIMIDGAEFWKDGTFVWLEREDNAALIAQYPGAECLYEMRRDLGVGF